MSRLRCALLTTYGHDWAASLVTAAPRLECVSLPGFPNPFGLPEDDADAVILTRNAFDWLTSRAKLNLLGSRAVIALDDGDDFVLGFPPDFVERAEIVVKPQGIYHDRQLYNYEVGPTYPGARWTEKLRPRSERYRALDKLRLSVPCFMTDIPGVRRRARAREPMGALERRGRDIADLAFNSFLAHVKRRRRFEVHCVVGLTHVQRIEAVQLLAGLNGHMGITRVATVQHIAGTEHRWDLPRQAREALLDEARPYMRERTGRLRFLFDLAAHKIGVAPTGYGEIGNRHADVLRAGAALVCQDLSHVATMFPFEDRLNVAYCRPDLSDLRRVVESLLRDDDQRRAIAHAGREAFARWAVRWRDHLEGGITAHIEAALS